MSELLYNPHFHYNDSIVNLSIEVAEMANTMMYTGDLMNDPKLRRANRIKSIHSSLAIENNSLTLEQVTDVINGKSVLAPPEDICEVKNADKAYKRLLHFNPYNSDDLEVAHGLLMKDLVRRPGQFRVGSVGVMRGKEVIHIAPRADMVSGLIADLLLWVKKSKVHPLIKSCVFHYEFEFIHPFPDGNGRMGRMWQTLLLYKWKEIFAWLPVETIIKENQQGYYKALKNSTDNEDCTEFIEFMLKVLHKTVKYNVEKQKKEQENPQQNLLQNPHQNPKLHTRIIQIMLTLKRETLSATEMMDVLGLKDRQSFMKNYIKPAIESGYIEMTNPEYPKAKNQKYRVKNPISKTSKNPQQVT